MTDLNLDKELQYKQAIELAKELKNIDNICVIDLDLYRECGSKMIEHLDPDVFNEIDKINHKIKYAVCFGSYEDGNMIGIPLVNKNLRQIIRKAGIISTVKSVPRLPAPFEIRLAGFVIHKLPLIKLS